MNIKTLQAKYEMTAREAMAFMEWNAGLSIADSQAKALVNALVKFRKVST